MRTAFIGATPVEEGTPTVVADFTPFTLSIQEHAEWYHNIKDWTFAYNITYFPLVGAPVVLIGSYTIQLNFFTGGSADIPSDEQHLGLPHELVGQDINSVVQLFHSFAAGAGALAQTHHTGTNPLLGWQPFFSCAVGGTAGVYSEPSGPGSPNISSLALAIGSMRGHSFDLYYISDDGFATYTSPTGTITITPLSYWEYRRSDGMNPMFNRITGVQLLPYQTDELP